MLFSNTTMSYKYQFEHKKEDLLHLSVRCPPNTSIEKLSIVQRIVLHCYCFILSYYRIDTDRG